MKINKYIKIILLLCAFTTVFTGCIKKQNSEENPKENASDAFNSEEKKDDNTEKEEEEELPIVDPIKVIIDGMSIEEKVGQMFIMGFDTYDIDANIEGLIRDNYLGGVILFGKNIDTIEQTKLLINRLNDLNPNSSVELFMSLDEEGGTVSRIPREMGAFEAAWQVGATGDLDYAFNHGKAIGEAVKSLGFNMDFAPVLDVNSNPNNPVIGGRAFSSDPQVVKAMATEVFKGLEKAEVIPVGKHFPGHGDTDVDSHFGVPVINKSLEELEALEFIPFEYAIERHIPAVMVSHLLLPNIDSEYVASMSPKIITEILRNKMGFNGIVITDDMIMEGAKSQYTTEEACIKVIEAGGDILIISSGYEAQQGAIKGVIEAVNTGMLSEDRINESVYRILKTKLDFDLVVLSK